MNFSPLLFPGTGQPMLWKMSADGHVKEKKEAGDRRAAGSSWRRWLVCTSKEAWALSASNGWLAALVTWACTPLWSPAGWGSPAGPGVTAEPSLDLPSSPLLTDHQALFSLSFYVTLKSCCLMHNIPNCLATLPIRSFPDSILTWKYSYHVFCLASNLTLIFFSFFESGC